MLKYSILMMIDEMHAATSEMISSLYHLFLDRQEEFEIIIVNNGVGSWLGESLELFFMDDTRVTYLELFTRNTEAVCLKMGLKESRGNIIVVYGSYQQISNESLLELLRSVEDGSDVVSPWRQHRKDSLFNQVQSKAYNMLINAITQSNIKDLGCKVKIFRREVLEDIEIYGDMYPYLPVLANLKGYKTNEVKCDHYTDHGKTGFYGVSMYFNRLIEIFILYFNTRFTRKPLRFFSTIGVVFFIVGVLITGVVFIQKLIFGFPIGDRPALLSALLFIVLGVQAASVGLVGEIIAFVHGRHRKEYTIETILK